MADDPTPTLAQAKESYEWLLNDVRQILQNKPFNPMASVGDVQYYIDAEAKMQAAKVLIVSIPKPE